MKRAIVLAGGGSKGAYQIGVWKALRELKIDYQIVTGTSVGALNGAFMVQQDFSQALSMWKNLNWEMIYDSSFKEDLSKWDIWKKYIQGIVFNGGMEVTGLEKTIDFYIDENKFYRSSVDFGLVTVNLTDLLPVEITKKEIPKELLKKYLLASASCFPAFQKTKIKDKDYIDGGYYDLLPISLAVNLGADTIIAVALDTKKVSLPDNAKEIPITIIQPHRELGSFLSFDDKQSQRSIILGYHDTLKVFKKLDGEIFTFKVGELAKDYQKFFPYLCEQLQQLLGKDYLKILQSSKYNSLLKKLPKALPLYTEIIECIGSVCQLDDILLYTRKKYQNQIKKYWDKKKKINFSISLKHYQYYNLEKRISYIFQKVQDQELSDSSFYQQLWRYFPKEFLASFYVKSLIE